MVDVAPGEQNQRLDHMKASGEDHRRSGGVVLVGTISRGPEAGHTVDVTFNVSPREVELLEEDRRRSACLVSGPHVLLLSILSLPVALFLSAIYSFYLATLTWYNIFSFVTDETHLCYKVLLAPLLVLTYPLVIVLVTCGVALYAGLAQLAWSLPAWYKEITDLEKGFCGWFCSMIDLDQCSPYQVVIITDIKTPQQTSNSPIDVLS